MYYYLLLLEREVTSIDIYLEYPSARINTTYLYHHLAVTGYLSTDTVLHTDDSRPYNLYYSFVQLTRFI